MRLSAAPLIWFGLLASSHATAAPPPPAELLKVDVPEPITLAPGESKVLVLHAVVAPGYHVQAQPPAHDGLIGAELKLGTIRSVKTGKPVYPKGHDFMMHGVPKPLLVYEGGFDVRLPLTAEARPPARPLTTTLAGTLRYQACNADQCMRPEEVKVEIRVLRTKAASRSE